MPYVLYCVTIWVSLLYYLLLQHSFSYICNASSGPSVFLFRIGLSTMNFMYASSIPGWILNICACISVYLAYLYVLQICMSCISVSLAYLYVLHICISVMSNSSYQEPCSCSQSLWITIINIIHKLVYICIACISCSWCTMYCRYCKWNKDITQLLTNPKGGKHHIQLRYLWIVLHWSLYLVYLYIDLEIFITCKMAVCLIFTSLTFLLVV